MYKNPKDLCTSLKKIKNYLKIKTNQLQLVERKKWKEKKWKNKKKTNIPRGHKGGRRPRRDKRKKKGEGEIAKGEGEGAVKGRRGRGSEGAEERRRGTRE